MRLCRLPGIVFEEKFGKLHQLKWRAALLTAPTKPTEQSFPFYKEGSGSHNWPAQGKPADQRSYDCEWKKGICDAHGVIPRSYWRGKALHNR